MGTLQPLVETTSFLIVRSLVLNTDVICPLPIEVLREVVQARLLRRLHVNLLLQLPPVSIVRHSKRTSSPAAEKVVKQLRLASRRQGQVELRLVRQSPRLFRVSNLLEDIYA